MKPFLHFIAGPSLSVNAQKTGNFITSFEKYTFNGHSFTPGTPRLITQSQGLVTLSYLRF